MYVSVQSKVFIVDDDDGVRDGLKAMLESEDISVEVYANGREFLDSYEPSHGGCLLLDLNMPVMSGQQVLDALARKGATLPVIIITSVDDPRVKAHALQAGAVEVLEKPLDHGKLLDAIQRAALSS